jgi:ATPase subunit of ABC transporter with duplicated ATPase domains
MILDGVEVLVLDEPTRNLSPLSNPVIRGVLASYKGAIISVTHDRKYMEEVAEKLYNLTEKGLMEKMK